MVGGTALSAVLLFWTLVGHGVSVSTNYYSFDGRGNNNRHKDWGAAGSELLRQQVKSVAYDDGIGSLAGDATRPSAREVSLRLSLPSARSQPANSREATGVLAYIAQFFGNEVRMSLPSLDDEAPIAVPKCDPLYDPYCSGTVTMPFKRSTFNTTALLLGSPREQMSFVTAFVDGSNIYGSSEEAASRLRTYHKGELVVDVDGILSHDEFGLGTESDISSEDNATAAGNTRTKFHPPMLAFQTLFIREHNRLARNFAEEHNEWSDESIFQEAKKWNVAQMQFICWFEYLPALGIQLSPYAGYKSTVNPTIDNFFSTVSHHHGHTDIRDFLSHPDDTYTGVNDDQSPLYGSLFSSSSSSSENSDADIDLILRQMVARAQAQVDGVFSSSFQHHLWGGSEYFGTDLITRNIQRCRDHGFPDYNTVRQEFGLGKVTSFSEITTDIFTQMLLESIYGNIDNIDAYVGGMAEDHVEDSSLGDTFYRSIKDQFERLRDGDRFYFENKANGLFTAAEIKQIKQTGLREIILRNTNITHLPPNIYFVDGAMTSWQREDGSAEVAPQEVAGAEEVVLQGDTTLKHWVEGSEVHFVLRAPSIGWLALGFEGPSGGMVEADIIVGRVANDEAEIVDSWSTSFVEPSADADIGGSHDATLHDFEEGDGFTQLHFSRPLAATDDKDRPVNLGEPTNIIFAWHDTSDALTYHGFQNRGKASITVTESGGGAAEEPAPPEIVLGGSLELADGAYSLSWQVDKPSRRKLLQDGAQMVHFVQKITGEGWIGLGIAGAAGGMIGADIMISSMSPEGDCIVEDFWSDSFVAPVKDTDKGGTSDITDVTCSRADGTTEFSFSRPVSTSDGNDHDFNPNGITPIIYAWSGDSDSIAYHLTNRGSADAETTEMEVPAGGGGGGGGSGDLVFAEAALNDQFTIMWAHTGEDEIVIKMALALDAWMGIGLEPEDGGMVNCDVYIGTFDGGSVHVGDYWSTGYAQPSLDSAQGGIDDLLDYGGSQEGGVSEVWFRRKMDTGDAMDMTIKNEPVDIIFAWGSAPALGYHGPAQRATVLINLASAEASVATVVDIGKRMIESHAGIMVLAWAGVGMIGVGIARFGRSWKYWLKAHRILQIGTTVIALIGEVIGFSYTRGSFRTAHSITALCVVFVTFPQVSLGAAAMRKSSNPNYNKLHRGTGYFLVGLALWQIWTGLLTLEVSDNMKNVYLAWVLALFIGFHFSSTVINQKEVDQMLKEARVPDEKRKQRRRSSAKKNLSRLSRGAGALLSQVEDVDEEEEGEDGDDEDLDDQDEDVDEGDSRRLSRKNSGLRNRSKSSKSSKELIELLIDDGSSDGESSSDESSLSDGATGWSKTDCEDEDFSTGPVTSEEFLSAIAEEKKWTIIDDSVYNLTHYMKEHPGGEKVLENIIGMDGTEAFLEVHGDDKKVMRVLDNLMVGDLIDQQGLFENPEQRRTSLLSRARTSIVGALSGGPRTSITEGSQGRDSDAALLGPANMLPSAAMPMGSPSVPQPELPAAIPEAGSAGERKTSLKGAMDIPRSSRTASLIPVVKSEAQSGTPGLERKVWKKFPILNVTELSDDVVVLRVKITGVSDATLPVTSHIMIKGTDTATGKVITRSFTPLIPNQKEHPGLMDILIKCYADGRMSRHIRTLGSGSEVEMKGPMTGLEYHNGKYQRIGLIGGGSGITPLWQVVEGILNNPDDHTKICLVYQNRYEKDILLREEIDDMSRLHPNQLRVCYVLSQPPSGWKGISGRVDKEILGKLLPPAKLPGSFVMVCGPPGMTKSLGGVFDIKTMSKGPGTLSDLGFDKTTMHIFE